MLLFRIWFYVLNLGKSLIYTSGKQPAEFSRFTGEWGITRSSDMETKSNLITRQRPPSISKH